MKLIQAEKLKKLCIQMFMTAGTPQEEAEIVVDNLVRTSLRGVDSHGVRAIPRYINNLKEGKIVPEAPIVVMKETLTTAMWDNNRGFGFVTGKKAMEAAMQKADKHGIGAVGTYNPKEGDDHIGALYYYAEMAALKGMIGIVTCSCHPGMAAWGGASKVIGVNPIAIAVPADKHPPIVWDIATSTVYPVSNQWLPGLSKSSIPVVSCTSKNFQPLHLLISGESAIRNWQMIEPQIQTLLEQCRDLKTRDTAQLYKLSELARLLNQEQPSDSSHSVRKAS